MAMKLTKGVEKRILPCGCVLQWKVCPKPWNDFARVDVRPDCERENHREEMREPWR